MRSREKVWRMRSATILTALVSVVLAACGGGGGQADPTAAATAPAASDPVPAEGDSITGTLGGDSQLEGGCAWIDDGETRWQVLYPEGYTVTFDPLTLTGPDGEAAAEGDTVTVTGAEQPDAMTTCQIGPVWSASSVTIDG